MNLPELQNKALALRRIILETALRAGKGHVPPAFSCVEILTALYHGGFLKFDAKRPEWADRDRFIFSKGHGCLALYAVLADLGFFPKKELKNFCTDGSMLAGHPDPLIPGVEIVSGSLGHGLGIGCGFALAAQKDKKNWRTVVLMGDGELNEGSVWEAAMFAGHHKLSNLVALVDRNKLSSTDFTEQVVSLEPLEDRFASFGWRTLQVNGHDLVEINAALKCMINGSIAKPTVIIANTVKGKGVRFMENSPLWHHRMPKGEEIVLARQELGLSLEGDFLDRLS